MSELMITRSQEVQHLEILYELTMSIGDSLDMRRMLKSSLSAFLKRLNCIAGGVYHVIVDEDGIQELEASHTIPRRTDRNATYQEGMMLATNMLAESTLINCAEKMPIVRQSESGSYYHLFELPNFGVLLLVKKKKPIDPLLVKSLQPLLKKLATAANACLLEEDKQQTLQYSETMLGGIINNATAVIYVKNVDGTYNLINRQYEKLFHITNKEIQGKTDHDLFPKEAADTFRENDLQIIRDHKTVTSEELVPHDDGLHTYISVKFPLFDASGEPYAVAGVSTDITIVKDAEDQVRQLAMAVEQSLNGTAIADMEGFIQFANPAWAGMHGYQVDELIGQPLAIFHTEEQLQNEVEPFNQKIIEVGSNQGEVGHKHKNGTVFPTWMTVVLLKNDDGIPIGLIASAQDITERKEAELKLRHQASLEKTGQSISSNLLDLPPEEVDAGITQALQMMGEFANVDRAYTFLYTDDGKQMSNTHEWCAEDTTPYIDELQGLPAADFSFLTKYINKQELFYVPRVADLPPEAAVEKAEFEKEGIQSIICVPLVSHGHAIGFIGFDAVHAEKVWGDGDISLLRLISNIFVSALARKEAAQILETALVQTENLYVAGREISSAKNLNEMLAATVKGIELSTISRALLITYERDVIGTERIDLVMANWHDGRGMPPPDVGARFIWENESANIITRSLTPIFLRDGLDDERMDDATLEILQERNTHSMALLPLVAGTRHLGALVLEAEIQTQFRQADVDRCLALAIQFTTAVDSYLLFERTQARAAALQTVASMSTVISAAMDSNELLQLVSDRTKLHFDLYHAHIFLMSDDGEAMELRAGAGESGEKLVSEKHRIPIDHPHSLVAKSVRTRKGVIANDVTKSPDYMSNPHLPNTQAEMAIPILMGDHVLGVLDLQSDRIGHFYQEDLDIQTTLASQIAVALQNARQYDETEEALLETKALLTITELANGTLDLDEVLDKVLAEALDVTAFKSGLFSIVNPESESLDLHAHRLPEKWVNDIRERGLDGTLSDLVCRDESPILITDLTEDAPIDVSSMLDDGYRSYQGVPLVVHGSVLGTLCLFGTNRLTKRESDIEWLSAVGQQVGVAIQNARLFEQSEKTLKEMDVLTRRLTHEGWDAYTDTQDRALSFAYDAGGVFEEGETAVIPATPYEHPLLVYGEEIGNFSLFSHDDDAEWDDETSEIITAVAAQLTARIENLRLTDETQRALSSTEAQAKQLATINYMAQIVSQQSNLEQMLETVYKELQTVIPTDSFFVGLYNAEASTLTIPINFEGEHYRNEALTVQLTPQSQSYKVIQSGQSLLRNLTAEEIALQGSSVIGDMSQAPTTSQLFIPLRAGAKQLGVLSIQSYKRDAYKESDMILLEGVANYVAVALENLRLFSETEERAEQLATINRVAQAISEQLDLEHMLESVYKQLDHILSNDSFFISFYNKENNTVEYPLIFEGEHRSSQPATPISETSSTRKVIDSGLPVLRHLTQEEAQTVYEEAVRDGTILGDHSQEITKSSMHVPMQSGQNMVGILSIQSYEFDVYTDSDVDLVMGIAQYLTIAIENIRLFTDTQMRASQLEKLSEIEGALSQAKSESEVMQALALFSDEDQAITLHYVEESEDDTPSYAYTVAHWENGENHPDDEYLMKPFLIEQHAGTNIGLRHPDQVTFIADIEQDARMDAEAIIEAQRIGYGAVVIVPMRSAGRWQGFISLKWPQAHQFTPDELFLWEQLREPVGSVVARRRAFMAQQGTLRETEALYEAGEKFNKASTYGDVLDVMREYTLIGSGAQNVSLNYFSEPWVGDEMPEEVYVLARRTAVSTEGKFQHTTPRYRLSDFPSVRQLLQRDGASLIEDVMTNPRFGEEARALYMNVYGAASTIFVPLVAGGQWFGYINAIYQQSTEFPEEDVRRLMVLAGQAAVSIQSIHLLDETTKRAQREQTLRQVTERVRGAANVETVLQTAVQELSRALGRRAFIQLSSDAIGEAEHEQ